jgi:hypothetical protein
MYGTDYPETDPTPYLLVLGDEELMDIPEFPDNEFGSCMQDSCHSFQDLVDIDLDCSDSRSPREFVPVCVRCSA